MSNYNTNTSYNGVFDNIIALSSNAFILCTTDGNMLQFNGGAAKMFGYEEAEFGKCNIKTLINHSDTALISGLHNHQSNPEMGESAVGIKKNGTRFPIALISVIHRNPNSNEEFLAKRIIDLSYIKKTEKLLEETSLLTKSGGWEADYINNEMSWTPGALHLLDIGPEHHRQIQSTFQLFDQPEILENAFRQSIHTGQPFDLRLNLTTPKGIKKIVRTKGYTVTFEGKMVRAYGTIQDITEEVINKQNLNKAEALFKTAFDNAGVGMAIINNKGEYIDVNNAYINFVGYSKQELSNMRIFDVTDDAYGALDKVHLQELSTGVSKRKEYDKKFIHKDGKVLWGFVTASAISNPDESFAFILAQVIDLTVRKEAEIAIVKSEQEYKSLFEQNPNAVCSLDLEGNITAMNRQLSVLLECPESQLKGESIFPFMIPEEMDDIFRKFNLVKSGQAQKFRCRVQTLKNKERTWIITYMPITVNRAVTGIYALINDITENVAEELELEKSLRDLKKILDASLDILCVLNIKGEFVRINKQVEELWGYEDWELVGKDIIDFVLEDDRRKTFEAFSQIKRGIELKDFENRMLKKDGSTIIMQWFASWDSMTHSVYASARHLKF